MDLLSHFPYGTPRDGQAAALSALQQEWNNFDVFVISAPTAAGKTALSKTIMNAVGSVAYIQPNNLLVQQVLQEFPDTPTLSRLDSYRCEEWARSCASTKGKLGFFCKGCDCSKALMRTKYKNDQTVMNYHIYVAHKAYREVVILDEAHNALPWIRERVAGKIWQHDYGYPSNMHSPEQVSAWIQTLPPAKRKHKKIQDLYAAVTYPKPEYQMQRTTDQFNGKGTARGFPEERDCIKLLPTDIRHAPPLLWPGLGQPRSPTGLPGTVTTQKVILMSATISRVDVEALGLDRHRVLYVNCESPIEPVRRPIILRDIAAVSRANQAESARLMAEHIDQVLAPFHEGEKGVVHTSYAMARELASHLGSKPRYLFHDKLNKKEQYEYFRAAPAESGLILIACGMTEGIDLPEDLGRWQVVSKIPWPSLGSPAVRYMADENPDSYAWETMKGLIQACGRICRTPEDYGVSYVLDSTIHKLLKDHWDLFPLWYTDALIDEGGGE